MHHRRRYLIICLMLTALLHLAANRSAAEYRFEPGITLSEEYNDNIFLAPQNPVHDYITRALPSIHFVYSAPVWDWDISYAYDYRYYAHKSREHDSTHAVTIVNHTSIIRESLFLDVREDYRRVSLDTSHDFTQQSLFVNQTDTNEFLATPYLRFNLSSHTSGTAGYHYRNIWYREAAAVNKAEHTLSVDLKDDLSERTAFTGGVRLSREDSNPLTYNKIDVYAGPRYEYMEGSSIWLILGNSWFSSDQFENGTQFFWDVGIAHRLMTYTLSFNAALSYIDDPLRVERREDRYVATFTKETERVAISASAGRREYRDVLTKHLQNTRTDLTASISYRLTTALRGLYSFDIGRFEDNQMRTYSMLYLNRLRLEYLFPADTALALDYSLAHGYSPDRVNFGMNYDNNRVALEIRKVF